MGKYVDGILLPGEEVVAEARPHWAMFIGPIILFAIGVLAGKAAGLFLTLAVIWGGVRLLVFSTTEMVLTNKRVIAKSGIIRRNVVDVANAKVEGVTYQQGIVGRIFGYGSVTVRGTGVGHVPVPFISRPDHFKQEVGKILYT